METIPVIRPPTARGKPKMRFSAIAPPIISAMSVAMATNSAWTQNAMRAAGLSANR